MNIDEAIKHCEEVAEKNEESIAYYTIQGDKEWLDECEKDCIEYAKECRQLAEWLRELKAYKEAREEIGCLPIVWEEGAGIRKCIDILDKHLKEVNADDT